MSVLAKRVEHFGFDRPGDRAVNFVCNMENASRVLKPFVLGSVVRIVCNAHPTSRRFGGATGHTCCKFGCYAVGGDDIRHYPFCPVVIVYVESRTGTEHIGDLLWHRVRSLGHFMILEQVHFEDIVRTLLWNDIVLQATNARRSTSATYCEHWRGPGGQAANCFGEEFSGEEIPFRGLIC